MVKGMQPSFSKRNIKPGTKGLIKPEFPKVCTTETLKILYPTILVACLQNNNV